MKKDLTSRQQTIQMLLDRWRQKQEEKDVVPQTQIFSEKATLKIGKPRRASKHDH